MDKNGAFHAGSYPWRDYVPDAAHHWGINQTYGPFAYKYG